MDVLTLEIRPAEDIAPAFAAMKAAQADAVFVVGDPLTLANRTRIHALTLAARLPTIYTAREFVEAGGLMSYGPNYPSLFRRAAEYVNKILRHRQLPDFRVRPPELDSNVPALDISGLLEALAERTPIIPDESR